MEVITLRVTPELRAKLDRMAALTGRNRAQVVRLLLAQARLNSEIDIQLTEPERAQTERPQAVRQ